MGLIEMDLQAEYIEANPFASEPDPVLARLTPVGRVPVLGHGDFILTETAAILRYLAALSGRRDLIPEDPRAMARMAQVVGVVDAYAYQPLVRQVFSQGFYQAYLGKAGDPEIVARGLALSEAPLNALENIADEGLQLNGGYVSLADLHLAPMIEYFVRVPAADALLRRYPALSTWWAQMQSYPPLVQTDPLPLR